MSSHQQGSSQRLLIYQTPAAGQRVFSSDPVYCCISTAHSLTDEGPLRLARDCCAWLGTAAPGEGPLRPARDPIARRRSTVPGKKHLVRRGSTAPGEGALRLASAHTDSDECEHCSRRVRTVPGERTAPAGRALSLHAQATSAGPTISNQYGGCQGWLWPATEVIMTFVGGPRFCRGQAAPRGIPTRHYGPDQGGGTTGMLHCAAGSIYCLGAQQIHAIAAPACSGPSRS